MKRTAITDDHLVGAVRQHADLTRRDCSLQDWLRLKFSTSRQDAGKLIDRLETTHPELCPWRKAVTP